MTLAAIRINVPDIAGWMTVGAYGVVVVIALLRQWWGWGRGWQMYSRRGTLVATFTPSPDIEPRPPAVFCPDHSRDVPDAMRSLAQMGKYRGHHFRIVVPAATGIWRWSYIIAQGERQLGKWRWRYECARNAFTRRFQEPEIDGCPECLPVKARDPGLSRHLGTLDKI